MQLIVKIQRLLGKRQGRGNTDDMDWKDDPRYPFFADYNVALFILQTGELRLAEWASLG
jgi:hypothetical protein